MGRLLVLLILLSGCASNKTSRLWQKLTLNDLNFVYETLKKSHPGPEDKDNPGFFHWLENGKKKAEELAKRVDSYEGYSFAIKSYTEGFNDGHLTFWSNYRRDSDQWPSFTISYRSGRYIVYQSKIEEVKKGDVLKSCDEHSLKKWYAKNIHPFSGAPIPRSKKYRYAPSLLVDRGNPFITHPKICTFVRNGKEFTHRLNYTSIKRNELNKMLVKAVFGKRGGFEFKKIKKGAYWMSLPTFSPNEKEQLVMKNYINKLKNIKDKVELIVFDVRGNTGGSSLWGDSLMTSLNGSDNIKAKKNKIHKNIKIDWRISEGNYNAIKNWPELFVKKFGRQSDTTQWARKFVSRFKKALDAKLTFMKQDQDTDKKTDESYSLNEPDFFKGKIYLLTDGRCGSACLDFADLVLSFKNAVQVGLETSGDTVYMEGNVVKTPTGLGSLYYPMKVWRGRRRGNLETYRPKFYWDGEISDTLGLQEWILRKAGKSL